MKIRNWNIWSDDASETIGTADKWEECLTWKTRCEEQKALAENTVLKLKQELMKIKSSEASNPTKWSKNCGAKFDS